MVTAPSLIDQECQYTKPSIAFEVNSKTFYNNVECQVHWGRWEARHTDCCIIWWMLLRETENATNYN
jgi:hypothetical protein